ncbi:MAG: MFS transporter [Desulfobacteraceae bacterium]
MRKYLILISAVLMQLCLGATYSWSVYVSRIKEMTGLLQGSVQLPFSVFYFVFPLTMIFSGMLMARKGPRFNAVWGGILFGSGWILAGAGADNFAMTVIGIGGLAGIGAGLAYIVPIATLVKWFPDHKGAVTGIAVAGFGGGAALVSQVGGRLISLMDKTPFEVFFIFGIVFILAVPLAGSAMVNPDTVEEKSRPAVKTREILRLKPFQLLYFAMFTGLVAGFTVNANLKDLFRGAGPEAGITAVSLFAVANAAGRISWGALYDRFSLSGTMKSNLLGQAVLLSLSPVLLTSADGFYFFAVASGFNYGGVLVLYAASTATLFPDKNIGQVYGLLFSSNIPAALFPMLSGYLYDFTDTFTISFAAISVMLISSVCLILLAPHLLSRPRERTEHLKQGKKMHAAGS